MTNEQAGDILKVLIEEMETNGYGEVIQIARARIEEGFINEGYDFNQSNRNLLHSYLNQSIMVLQALSAESLPETIATINKFTESDSSQIIKAIDNIAIQLINEEAFNLTELPNYSELIGSLKTIQEQLNQE